MLGISTVILMWFGAVATASEDVSVDQSNDAVAMEWEEVPDPPPPRAWIGGGVSWSTGQYTNGGQPGGAGLDFTWLTDNQQVYHTLRFSHRTWRAPASAIEDRLAVKGVSEGVQGYWSGRMTLSSLTKFIHRHKRPLHFGAQGGWLLQRTQHVGAKTQRYLIREHDLYWGPLWTAHLGAQLHLGVYEGEEAFRATGFGRFMAPLAARLNRRGEGMVLDGRMADPVEAVAPEIDAGLSLGTRWDPYFISLDVGTRLTGPSAVDRRRDRNRWREMLVVDVSLSKAF